MFAVRAMVDDTGKWTMAVDVPNGTTVQNKEVARLLALCLEWVSRAPDQRAPTMAEVEAFAAARALPDGWAPTLDAVNIKLNDTTNVKSFTRTYRYGAEDGEGGPVVEAPCAEDGSPIPATREALLAVEHGRAPDPVATSPNAVA